MDKFKSWFIATTVVVLIFFSCNKEDDTFGDTFLDNDKVNVIDNEYTQFSFRHIVDTSVDLNGANLGLLGIHNDPVFGKTKAGFASQFRISSNPNFADTMIFDSVKLFIKYNGEYGDTAKKININFYELDQSISFSQDYKVTFDINPLLGSKIGEYEFNKKNVFDTIFLKSTSDPEKDSVNASGNKIVSKLITQMEVELDSTFGADIFYADPSFFESGEAFLDLLKGICILPQGDISSTERGAIYDFDLLSSSTGLFFYYHYYTNDDDGRDTTNSTYSINITDNSAAINLFEHDNSGTTFGSVLNGTSISDSLIYLQGMAGSKVLFTIPGINNWKDSSNTVINQARLTLRVERDSAERVKYPVPVTLQLNALNKDGDKTNLTSQTFTLISSLSGNYLSGDNQYIFSIPLYLQSIIDGENENDGFELFVFNPKLNQGRVTLINNTQEKNDNIILKIKYLKTQ